MSKQIASSELAMLVTQLLMDPDAIGQDIDRGHFSTAIAQVVADFCGGHAYGASHNDEHNTANMDGVTVLSPFFVSVHPNDSLPSLEDNVWAPFDPQGWEDETAEDYDIEKGTPLTQGKRNDLQKTMAQTMLQAAFQEMALNRISGVQTTVERIVNNGIATTKLAFIDNGILVRNPDCDTYFEPLTASSHSITHFYDAETIDSPQSDCISFVEKDRRHHKALLESL